MSSKRPGRDLIRSAAERLAVTEEALAEMPVAERVMLGAGLTVLGRCAAVVDRVEDLVEDQRAVVRRSRQVLEMFPPLLGKLGRLLDLEIEAALKRLGRD